MTLARLHLALVVLLATVAGSAQNAPRFAEDLILSGDRAGVIATLVPTSEAAFFHRTLYAQHRGLLNEAAAELEAWRKTIPAPNARRQTLENRQALLRFAVDPESTYTHLIEHLNPTLDHRRSAAAEARALPTRIEPSQLSLSELTQATLSADRRSLSRFSDDALPRLIGLDLSEAQRAELLERLDRPDVPGLVDAILRDLDERKHSAFNDRAVHRALTLAQLEELAQRRPELLTSRKFVDVFVERLAPGVHVDIHRDPDARRAWLARLEAFTTRLPSTMNAMKANVLFHRMLDDERHGIFDRERFVRFLRLPSNHGLRTEAQRARPSNERIVTGSSFIAGLDKIGNEGNFVRRMLMHFLARESSVAGFTDFIDRDALREIQAEAKILAGSGDDSTWFAQLPPSTQQSLRERVEITFAPNQKRVYAANDNVTLELDVKNVGTLTVAVYDIDVAGLNHSLHAQISLDGLVPHTEVTVPVDAPAQRRVRLEIPVPALERPGSYIVDVIGNGLANRAVIEKGRLGHITTMAPEGHHVRVFSESGDHLQDATLTIERRTFEANEDGVIVVPFTSKRRPVEMVLEHGRIATRGTFTFEEEFYWLHTGFWVNRESLGQSEATLVMRPTLTLNDELAPLALLRDVTLRLSARNIDGIISTDIIRDIVLNENDELVHEFAVPDRLASLSATLSANIETQSGERKDIFSSHIPIKVNSILRTTDIATPLLIQTPDGWSVDVLGRNGEPIVDKIVDLQLRHRDFTAALPFQLRTDTSGRAHLGRLPHVKSVSARLNSHPFQTWTLERDQGTSWWGNEFPSFTAAAGEDIRIPWSGASLDRHDVTLIELRRNSPYADRFSQLAVQDGVLVATGLPAGHYELKIRSMAATFFIDVTPGQRRNDIVTGTKEVTSPRPPSLLRIHPIEVDGDDIVVRLGDVSNSTRLHVIADRFVSRIDRAYEFARPTPIAAPSFDRNAVLSEFNSTRPLSREERYVLARQKLPVHAGNMLDRPSLLINPLTLDVDTSYGGSRAGGARGVGGGTGGGFGKLGGRRSGSRPASGAAGLSAPTPDFGFFADGPMVRLDVPLVNGVARLPRTALGSRHLIQAIAIDEFTVVTRTHALPEPPLARRDRRLAESLPTDRPVIQRQRFDVLEAGSAVSIDRATTQRHDLVDSLESVYTLQRSLQESDELAPFDFIVQWPGLSADEKLDRLSRFACHELHVFLHEKDRPFFDKFVRTTIVDKRRHDFIDRWLLDEDLTAYTESWSFSQLNAAEKALLARALPERREATRRWLEARTADVTSQRGVDTMFAGSSLGALSGRGRTSTAVDEALEIEAAFESTNKLRKQARRLWAGTPPLRKYIEHRYWNRTDAQAPTALIKPGRFWSEFAAADASAPFVSTAITEAARSVSECLLVLAFTDLPFVAGEHERTRVDTTTTITLANRALVAREEVVTEERPLESTGLVLGETIRHSDQAGGTSRPAELLIGTPYIAETVITNPTADAANVHVLMQIPAGAIPLASGRATIHEHVAVAPFGTSTLSQSFYFPDVVPASITPAQASLDSVPIARAEITALPVVAEPTQIDTTTWEHIAENGTLDDVLTALETADLASTNLALLAWRMSDANAFGTITDALRARFIFHPELWAYALHHRDEHATSEFLAHDVGFVAQCGGELSSPLLTIEPELRGMHQHIEFAPLFRGRSHDMPGDPRFFDKTVEATWGEFLEELSWKAELDDIDHLDISWWLLLQDRVPEAFGQFGHVDTTAIGLSIRLTYLRAYIAMSSGEAAAARDMARPHIDHPLAHWRERFRDVVAHADEAESTEDEGTTPDEATDDAPDDIAKAAPSLFVSIDSGDVVVEHENIGEYELSFTPVDIELLFSSKPFDSTASGRRMVTRPQRSQVVTADGRATRIPLPDEYRNQNALVQVSAAGLVDRTSSEAHSMSVRVAESQGEVKVTDGTTRAPLPATYVKVYAKLRDGTEKFHKDGYTDLRGRFDYASLTAQNTSPVETFAILIVSQEHGATRREVRAPLY